jgi:hypothetical protein
MEKKLLLCVVVVVCLCGVTAMALDPMGPPAAGLKQGQWSAGIDYSSSDMDLKLDGKVSWNEKYWSYGEGFSTDSDSWKFDEKVKGVKANKIYANIGYGIMDNWDVFVRLGGADGDFDYANEDIAFDSDYVFAYGFGTRMTFWQDADLKIGGLFQMSWANGLKDTKSGVDAGSDGGYAYADTWSWSGEVDITEFQIAIGPTWTPAQGFSIYGGPFLHFVTGSIESTEIYTELDEYDRDIDIDTYKMSGDITEDSCFGGYIGAQVQLGENAFVSGEWMTTGDAQAYGVGVVCKFK